MKSIPAFAVSALSVATLLTFSACHKSATTDAGGVKKFRIAFVTNNASDYWTLARAGCEKAVAELKDVDLDYQIPSDGSVARQRQIVDDLLNRGEDGIAISPIDPANQTDYLQQVAKQCLLVTQDSDAPKSGRAFYIGTDNIAAGKQAGELVKEALPNGGKIMAFVGNVDAQNAHERLSGLKQALEGSNVQLLDVRTDDTDHVRAKANVQDAIVKYPDLALCVGLWSYNGPAIVGALKDSNKIGQIKVVAFDQEEETIAGVKSGAIYAAVVQQPDQFGYQAIKMMEKILTGDKSVIPANGLKIIPTLAIKADSVDAYMKQLKEMRGQ
jgi:ribose transport system substrate-binding protein